MRSLTQGFEPSRFCKRLIVEWVSQAHGEDFMYRNKSGDTQVYSPLGSFVVERHGEARRYARHDRNTFGREQCIALVWTLLIATFLAGSIYHRSGSPELAAATPAGAAVYSTASGPATPYQE